MFLRWDGAETLIVLYCSFGFCVSSGARIQQSYMKGSHFPGSLSFGGFSSKHVKIGMVKVESIESLKPVGVLMITCPHAFALPRINQPYSTLIEQ